MVVADFMYKTVKGFVDVPDILGMKSLESFSQHAGHPHTGDIVLWEGGEYEVLGLAENHVWLRRDGTFYTTRLVNVDLLISAIINMEEVLIGGMKAFIKMHPCFAIGDMVQLKVDFTPVKIWTIKTIIGTKAWLRSGAFDTVKELSSITKV